MAKGWKTVYTNTNTSTGNKLDFKAFDKAGETDIVIVSAPL